MAKRYWVPDAVADENVDLGSLMELAAAALRAEDEALAGFIEAARLSKPEPPRRHSSAGAGRGLSYWVYETTLVYTVWRGWMKAGKPAALDWSLAQLEGNTEKPSKLRGKSYDLVVFSSESNNGFVFEAKRWSYSPKAMVAAICRDADKLRDMPRELPLLADPQKFILLFSYEGSEGRDDRVADFCEEARLLPAGRAVFPAWFWRGMTEVRGSLVLTALQVRPRRNRG